MSEKVNVSSGDGFFIGAAILIIFMYGSPSIWDGITCRLMPDHCEFLQEEEPDNE